MVKGETLRILCDPMWQRPRVGDLVDLFVREGNLHDGVGTRHVGQCLYLGRRRARNGDGPSTKLDVFWGSSGIFSCPNEDEAWSGTIVSLLKDHI